MAEKSLKLNAPTTVGYTVPPVHHPGCEFPVVGEYQGFGDINQLDLKVAEEPHFMYKAKART